MRYPVPALCISVFILGGCISSPSPVKVDDEPEPHEYAPIERFEIEELEPATRRLFREHLDSFDGATRTGGTVDLPELRETNPVVLLTIFAEWCENCAYEAPELVELFHRFGDRGFAVVARSEYSHPAEVERFVEEHGIPYPVILGSPNPDPENEDAVRTTTSHFALRKALDDPRKWGTPMNLLVVDGDLERVHMVLGEFVPEELDAFLDERLPEARPMDSATPTTD